MTYINPPALGDLLGQFRATIETIVVDFDEFSLNQQWRESTRESLLMGSFADFERLRYLEVSQATLFGLGYEYAHDDPGKADRMRKATDLHPRLLKILPKSIEHLVLHYCDVRVEPQVEETWLNHKTAFPRLRKCDINYEFRDYKRPKRWTDWVKTSDQGIQFTFHVEVYEERDERFRCRSLEEIHDYSLGRVCGRELFLRHVKHRIETMLTEEQWRQKHLTNLEECTYE